VTSAVDTCNIPASDLISQQTTAYRNFDGKGLSLNHNHKLG